MDWTLGSSHWRYLMALDLAKVVEVTFSGRRLEESIIAGLRGGVCHRAIVPYVSNAGSIPPVPLCQHEDSYITSEQGVEGLPPSAAPIT